MDPYLNIAKIESFSKYCFAINDTRFLDIVFTDAIKDVTDSESKYLDFSTRPKVVNSCDSKFHFLNLNMANKTSSEY